MKFYIIFIGLYIFCALSFSAKAQIILTKVSDMNFGTVVYVPAHSGNVELATNGSVSFSSGTGLSLEGSSNAGNVLIEGNPLDVIEIKCNSEGVMRLSNNGIDIQNVEIAIDSGLPAGSANACNGTKKKSTPAMVVDLAVNPNPNVLMGGVANITANSLVSGTYNTTNGGAQPIKLTIIFQ